ncbi:MAG: M23 family metallopeptidase [Rickettsiaceae bacterium]|nr:M23 family metallopeptidase [Rickettsiaceae bacterium]
MRYLIAILLILSSCTQHNLSEKLVKNINEEVKKSHNIDDGYIIAKYDLAGLSNHSCLYLKNYGRVINSSSENRSFINRMIPKISKKSLIMKRAKAKLEFAKEDLTILQARYNIFSDSEFRKIAAKKECSSSADPFSVIDEEETSDYLKDLQKLDKIVSHIPIFFPHGRCVITSPFGIRKHPITKAQKMHSGIDLRGTKKRAPIYAAADGHVILAHKSSSYGNVIMINHGNRFKTKYAHLHKMFVKKGDKVIEGQEIGIEGDTGMSTSHHLHFEVIFNDSPINPSEFISRGYKCQNI